MLWCCYAPNIGLGFTLIAPTSGDQLYLFVVGEVLEDAVGIGDSAIGQVRELVDKCQAPVVLLSKP